MALRCVTNRAFPPNIDVPDNICFVFPRIATYAAIAKHTMTTLEALKAPEAPIAAAKSPALKSCGSSLTSHTFSMRNRGMYT